MSPEREVDMSKKDITTIKVSKATHSKIAHLSKKTMGADYGGIVDRAINCLMSAIATEGWHVLYSQSDSTLSPVIGNGTPAVKSKGARKR